MRSGEGEGEGGRSTNLYNVVVPHQVRPCLALHSPSDAVIRTLHRGCRRSVKGHYHVERVQGLRRARQKTTRPSLNRAKSQGWLFIKAARCGVIWRLFGFSGVPSSGPSNCERSVKRRWRVKLTWGVPVCAALKTLWSDAALAEHASPISETRPGKEAEAASFGMGQTLPLSLQYMVAPGCSIFALSVMKFANSRQTFDDEWHTNVPPGRKNRVRQNLIGNICAHIRTFVQIHNKTKYI